jgi:hypothetical protein
MVRTRATEVVPPEQVPESRPEGEDPAVLDAWLAEGAAKATESLRAAGPDQKVWSWG